MQIQSMRAKFIVPAVVIIGLLLSVFIHPHPQRRKVPDLEIPQPSQKSPRPVAPTQLISPAATPAKLAATETPKELVLAKLREWDDDDRPDLREQRIRELAALLDGTNTW